MNTWAVQSPRQIAHDCANGSCKHRPNQKIVRLYQTVTSIPNALSNTQNPAMREMAPLELGLGIQICNSSGEVHKSSLQNPIMTETSSLGLSIHHKAPIHMGYTSCQELNIHAAQFPGLGI